MKRIGCSIICLLSFGHLMCQQDSAFVAKDTLNTVTIRDNSKGVIGGSRLYAVEGLMITQGKKSELINMDKTLANTATNNSRQIFARIPGLNIFENDGSGQSVGIGGRGLNPNRMSNFNTRQNGYDISADALGYPESYYTPPTEAVDRIEILRGAASLQFGTQFGGMLNYRLVAPSNEKFHFKTRLSSGSFGLFNAYNQGSGSIKKWQYLIYHQFKKYSGWRPNSQLQAHNLHVFIGHTFDNENQVSIEYTHSSYLQKQPGGLTLKQFMDNPESSSRSRNWFQVNWNILQFKFSGYVSKHWKTEIQFAQLIAQRDALGSLERIDRLDPPNSSRNLLRDRYNNQLFEARFLRRLPNKLHNPRLILIGTRLYRGNTLRQQGLADTTDQAHFHFIHPDQLENGSFRFPTANAALFAEYVHRLNTNLALIPGIRLEHINTSSAGYYRLLNKDLAGNILLDTLVQESRKSQRNFALFGLGANYRVNNKWDIYLNFSRNYRSINFNDMRVANPNFQVDLTLKDESGFTADAGVRGEIPKKMYLDISGFYLFYNDRIGTILQFDSTTFQIIRYRTNIGQSSNIGIETLVECDWSEIFYDSCRHHLSSFVNFSFVHARYHTTSFSDNSKKVEYVPSIILRTGINYTFQGYKAGITYAYTSLQFSDASNTVETPSATLGQIPAYHVVDLSMEVPIKKLRISFGCNNLLDATYFTRRAEGYPGPGIIPSDPRNYYLSLTLEI